jgi:hypothetical protein
MLIKQLINQQDSVTEGYTSDDLARFNKICGDLDNNLEKMSRMLRDGSALSKLVEKLGGDMAQFKQSCEAFDKLYDSFQDLHMYTDISARDKKEE